MSKADTIDEVLDKLAKSYTAGHVTDPDFMWIDDAKAALSTMVAEIIGERPIMPYDASREQRLEIQFRIEAYDDQVQRAIAKGFTL